MTSPKFLDERAPSASSASVALSGNEARPQQRIAGAALAKLSTEQLTGRLWTQRRSSVGVDFARSQAAREDKARARARVLALCSPRCFHKGLSMLTMPGLTWTFERDLLALREGRGWVRGRTPDRTYITGIERDEAVYRASIKYMPGVVDRDMSGIAHVPPPPFATCALRTYTIPRYIRCAFEDYAGHDFGPHRFNAAWLDFNGQLAERRLEAIEQFWPSVRALLVITLLRARTTGEMTGRIAEAGSLGALFANRLPDSVVVDVFNYRDTSPMVQIAIARADAPMLRDFLRLSHGWAVSR